MELDESLISYVARRGNAALVELQQLGISREHFVDEYRTVWGYILKAKRQHDTVPSMEVLTTRFPDLTLERVARRDIPILVHDIRQRDKFIKLLTTISTVADTATTFDVVDEVIQRLQGELNSLAYDANETNHIVDLFSASTNDRIMEDLRQRRRGVTMGIPTGLESFDREIGGLQKQKMVVAMGRPGKGKSWLDLLFVAQAVLNGKTVLLYPLEMTLTETAYRLFTLFSSRLLGQDRVFRNMDMQRGRVSPRRMQRFLDLLTERFPGQLYVADVGSINDPYTNERIEAEVEMYNPDMFWVDYITLLKPPPQARGQDDNGWGAVRALSHGIKNTAMRRNCVGGCSAQVNREAQRGNEVLPRIENIAYGDSIGQDADLVFSLNRDRNGDLLYALVKNRGGPEIGQTSCVFHVNEGILHERPRVEQEDSEGE